MCDLEVAFLKAKSTRFNDNLCIKDLSNRPICAVLNTHKLDMILIVYADSNESGQNCLK